MLEKITVQMVADDPSTGELVLYFVKDGPWPQDENAYGPILKRIQDEILDVVDASLDGGVAAVYPDSIGKRIRIQVDSPLDCPEKLGNLVLNIEKYLAESEEYASAIKRSKFITGVRVVTGHTMGRFEGSKGATDV